MTDVKSEFDPNLEESFEIFHRLLELNSSSFSLKSEVHETNEILKPKTEKDIVYLCIEEVEKQWPELTSTYKAIVKCLMQIKSTECPTNEKKVGVDQPPDVTAKQQDTKQITSGDNDVTSGQNTSVEAINADSRHLTADKTCTSEPEPVKPKPELNLEKPADGEKVAELTKPTTKPRTISVTKDSRVIENGIAKVPPTAHKRQSSLEASSINKEPSKVTDNLNAKPKPTAHKRQSSSGSTSLQSNKTPQKPTAPIPSASSGPRKKHAAPKPPGPPPNSSLKSPAPKVAPSSHGSPSRTKASTKAANGTPGSTGKALPPRPKPPSIKKNVSS